MLYHYVCQYLFYTIVCCASQKTLVNLIWWYKTTINNDWSKYARFQIRVVFVGKRREKNPLFIVTSNGKL